MVIKTKKFFLLFSNEDSIDYENTLLMFTPEEMERAAQRAIEHGLGGKGDPSTRTYEELKEFLREEGIELYPTAEDYAPTVRLSTVEIPEKRL
jgi:hypothetical protein